MIFSSTLVELSVVDTHPPTGDSPLRNELTLRITVIPPSFGTTYTELTHSLSEIG
jgi:hypothetical protein